MNGVFNPLSLLCSCGISLEIAKHFAGASLFVSDAHILCSVESTIFEIMLTASTDKQWTQLLGQGL